MVDDGRGGPGTQTDRRRATRSGHVRPHFLGIGAQKAGTTWLHRNLDRHPDVFFAPRKEIHFWDWHRHRGLDWYERQFAKAPAGAVTGEISPSYAVMPADDIVAIREHNPHIALLMLVRDPRERAWSAARMALTRAEMTEDEASDQWFVDHFRSQASRSRGDYASCLSNWWKVFPPDQLLVETFDAIVDEPRALLARVGRHIGVDIGFYDDVDEAELAEAVFPSGAGSIRPSLASVLDELYLDHVDPVEQLLGRDLPGWRRPLV